MILSMENQALLFLTAVLIGAVSAFIFDIFRLLRKIMKHPDFLVQFEDVIYWLVVSFIMFYVMLLNNYGEIRFFLILGFSLGMVLYFLTISRLFMKVSVAIVNFLKKVFMALFRIIMLPIKLLLRILRRPAAFLLKKAQKTGKGFKKILQKIAGYVKIKRRKAVNNLKIVLKKR